MVDFLQGVVPIRFNTSKKLISHDINSNTYNYKYVFSVEVVPVCKDNIVCLPLRLAKSLGSIGQIVHVQKVTHLLHLIDPNTAQVAEINASTYFKSPFQTLVKPKQLTEYTVINIEPISDGERHKFSGQGAISKRVSRTNYYAIIHESFVIFVILAKKITKSPLIYGHCALDSFIIDNTN